ncbi:hypothetical protein E2C01_039113 [Portunus trituberculatus]|uniref:Uncharacterized protein n=1 Tax=Portunus trituberculatus TaxID=210409 RepID=A0A5B7FIS4_PORTR|nr:hypothetical protein [Portunus trituberculatus]
MTRIPAMHEAFPVTGRSCILNKPPPTYPMPAQPSPAQPRPATPEVSFDLVATTQDTQGSINRQRLSNVSLQTSGSGTGP